MARTFYLSQESSDLSGGADFDKNLALFQESASSINVPVANSSTETSYAFTPAGILDTATWNADGNTHTIKVNVTSGSTSMFLSIIIDRISSTGSVLESSTQTTEQTLSTGVKTFTVSKAWTSPASTNRLRIRYIFRSSNSHGGAISVTIETGVTNSEVTLPFTVPLPPPIVTNLDQYAADRKTPIAVGGTISSGSKPQLMFDVSPYANTEGNILTPKIEAELIATAFDNVANETGAPFYWDPDQPSGLRGMALAYDSIRKRFIMSHGSLGSGYLTNTWELQMPNASTPRPKWRKLTPTGTTPPNRYYTSAVFDATNNRFLMFGGYNGSDLNDLWELSFASSAEGVWTNRTPGSSPPVRANIGHGMANDPANNKAYLFAGWGASLYNDIWELNYASTAVTWTQRAANDATNAPARRRNSSVVFDSNSNRLVTFGGYTSVAQNDVHFFDLSTFTWSVPTISGTAPATRELHNAFYDPNNDRMIIYNGYDGGSNYRRDVFALSLGASPAWTNISPAGSVDELPLGGYGAGTAYDSENKIALFMGGVDQTADTSRRWCIFDVATDTVGGLAMNDNYRALDAPAFAHNPVRNEFLMSHGYQHIPDNSTIADGNHGTATFAYDVATNRWRNATVGLLVPHQREGSMMVYDTVRDRFLFFGGYSGFGEGHNDLWEAKVNSNGDYVWKKLTPSGTLPGRRWLGVAKFYAAGNKLIIGLGSSGTGGSNYTDFWQCDFTSNENGAWSTLTLSGTTPTGRWAPAFCDYGATSLFIFGGATGTGDSGYTNTSYLIRFDTNASIALTTSGAPSARRSAVAVQNGDGGFDIFGGHTGSVQNDHYYLKTTTASFWETGFESWQTKFESNPGNKPAARRSHAGFKANNGDTFYTAGRPVSGEWYSDTFRFSGSTWTNMAPRKYQRVNIQESSAMSDGSYHWQAWVTEADTSTDSTKVSYGGNAESAADFIIGAGGGGTGHTSTPTDTATTADATVKATGKRPADTATATDANTKRTTKSPADTASASDTPSTLLGRKANPADSVTASDANAKATGKAFADATATTDSTGKAISPAKSDTANASDTPLVTLQKSLQVGDTVTITDQGIFVQGHRRTVADTVSALEAIGKALAKINGDTATTSDTAAKKPGKNQADTATTTDANAKSVQSGASDSATVTDQATDARGWNRTFGDFANLADQINKAFARNVGDTATTSDNASTGAQREYFAGDSATVTDDTSKKPGKTTADTSTPTDNTARSAGRYRTEGDSVQPVDANHRAVTTSSADTATTADATSKKPGKAVSDIATATDSLQTAFGKVLALADTASVLDQAIKAVARSVSDTANAVDGVSRSHGRKISASDSTSVSESSSRRAGPGANDSVSTSDNQTYWRGLGHIIADILAPYDEHTKAFGKFRDDNVNAIDDEAGGGASGIGRFYNAEDIVTTSDDILKAMSASLEDTANAVDVGTPSAGFKTTAGDTASVADASFRRTVKQRSDNAFASDTASIFVAYLRAIADSITATDSASKRPVLAKSDSIATTDATLKLLRKATNDTITAADAASRAIQKALSDMATVAENQSTNGMSAYYHTVNDSVLAIDFYINNFVKSLAETAVATDAAVRSLNKRPSDTVTTTDNEAAKFVLHPEAEVVGATDQISRKPGKATADSATADDTSRRTIGKLPADTINALDTQAKAVYRLAIDSVTAIDSILQGGALYHFINDQVFPSDSHIKRITMLKQETLTPSDETSALNAITILRSDSVMANELSYRAMSKPTADQIVATDVANQLAAKGILLTDIVVASDMHQKAIAKQQADQAFVLDIIAKTTLRLVEDQIGASDLTRNQIRKVLADGQVVADALSKVIRITRSDTVTISDEAIEDAVRIVTGNIIARAARQNSTRGGRIRATGAQ